MLRGCALAVIVICSLAEDIPARRELRQLSDLEHTAVIDALSTMKATPASAGRSRFGPHFRNYDELVEKHMNASLDPRCDQAHLGAAFLTYHRALVREFELSLLAVVQSKDANTSLTALPYYDFEGDAAELRTRDPAGVSVFTDAWLGAATGDESRGFTLPDDSPFASWRVANASGDTVGSPYGLLRSPWNFNSAPTLTRAPTSCGASTQPVMGAWVLCFAAAATYRELYACQEPTVHTWLHSWLGGVWTAGSYGRDRCYIRYSIEVPELQLMFSYLRLPCSFVRFSRASSALVLP